MIRLSPSVGNFFATIKSFDTSIAVIANFVLNAEKLELFGFKVVRSPFQPIKFSCQNLERALTSIPWQ